ncbi:MAG: adenosine deaminase family protein [Verrucomicrobiae bacterium]|nr:adenosine deaminase family protein [Verrucomicrobiae bacterium]MDW8342960.1 adenosine deaminase family protein [Verrucomicrobiae bacterium]
MKAPAAISTEFIRRIPKTDLHVHLDGSLRLPTLIELARQQRVRLPSYTEEGLRRLVFKDRYANLPEYLKGFAYTCAVMQDAESLERIAFELAEDNLAEGVRYLEVRFAPQLHVHDRLPMENVVRAVVRGLERAQRRHNRSAAVRQGDDVPFYFGVIVCALRFVVPTMSEYYRRLFAVMPYARTKQVAAAASLELARAAVELARRRGLPIVGFDLAGAEAGYPAEDHQAAFQYAHSNFLRKTVHAGEAYGPESIFQAITRCYANRIGHGTWLFAHRMVQNPAIADPVAYTHHLVEYIASQRITIEVCLTSNAQTLPAMRNLARHPLRQMLDHEMSVTICTDNRLVSNTTVTRELELAVQKLRLTPREFRNVIVAGFKGSFFPGTYREKRRFVRQVLDRYERLERALGGQCVAGDFDSGRGRSV